MPHVWSQTDNRDWNRPSGHIIGTNQRPHAGTSGVLLQEVYLRYTKYQSGGQRNSGMPPLGKWIGDDWKLIFQRRGNAVTHFNARVTVTDWGERHQRVVGPPDVPSPNGFSEYVAFQFAIAHFAYFDAEPTSPPWIFPALEGGYGEEIIDLYDKGVLKDTAPQVLRVLKW